jgi:hypothetical protein
MSLTTPPSLKRRHSGTIRRHIRPLRSVGYTVVYALTTPGRRHHFWQFSAGSDPLSTLSTPYIMNNNIEGKMGVLAPVYSRHQVQGGGVDTQGVDTGDWATAA